MDVLWLPSRYAPQKDAQPALLDLAIHHQTSPLVRLLVKLDAAPNNGAHGRRPGGDYAKTL
jgi:hypothetical protein